MEDYRRNIRYRFYRFFWIKGVEVHRWAGRQMVRIANELIDVQGD